MRSSSLARVVMGSLGVSVVITLGCGKPPTEPSPPPPAQFSVRSISPSEGPTVLATIARIEGTGFQSGDTVTVDGSRVDATVLSATTISLAMPAHAAGTVDVTVSRAGALSHNVPGGYRYAVPVISELLPNIGSTAGGFEMSIRGTGFTSAYTVTVDSIVSPLTEPWTTDGPVLVDMPAHAAGPVEVMLTDRYGQSASAVFTYVSPATLDFQRGLARGAYPSPLVLTIRDNVVVAVSCGASSLTPNPPPVVANGEFSFAGSGGVTMTGKILTPTWAIGSISNASCARGDWWARKKSVPRTKRT